MKKRRTPVFVFPCAGEKKKQHFVWAVRLDRVTTGIYIRERFNRSGWENNAVIGGQTQIVGFHNYPHFYSITTINPRGDILTILFVLINTLWRLSVSFRN